MRLRIVHLVEDLPRGGMETLVADVVRGQRAAGHQVQVVCLRDEGTLADRLREEGIGVSLAGVRRVRPASLLVVRRMILAPRPHVAHLHGMGAGTFGRLALIGRRVRTVFHVHTQISIAHSGLPSLARRERLLARLPGVILAISEAVKHDLTDTLGLDANRIEVLSGGVPDVPLGDRTVARTSLGVADEQFIVVCAAALKEHKGQEVLIRAVASVPGACLLLAGEGPNEARLRALVDDLGLHATVRFLGHVDDIPALLAAADIVALTSFPREGLSLSAIEALRAGRPAVVSDVGGLPEVVRDGDTGLVVAADDPDALAAALRTLRDDEDLRRRMGDRGRQHFLERFELSSYLAALDELYRS